LLTYIAIAMLLVLNVSGLYSLIMDVGLTAILFASKSIPTTFGQLAAALAGAGALIFVATGFVKDASWNQTK